jgi:hypothetical protein
MAGPGAGTSGWTMRADVRSSSEEQTGDVKHTRNRREIIVGIIPHDLTNIRDDVS